MGVRTYRQQIAAGGAFDGSAPTGDPTTGSGVTQWAAQAAGGLFDPAITYPSYLEKFEFHVTTSTAWSCSKKDSNGVLTVLFSGTDDTDFITGPDDRFLLNATETIVVTAMSPGGADTMKAEVSVSV